MDNSKYDDLARYLSQKQETDWFHILAKFISHYLS
jgi:hypothetical protein